MSTVTGGALSGPEGGGPHDNGISSEESFKSEEEGDSSEEEDGSEVRSW